MPGGSHEVAGDGSIALRNIVDDNLAMRKTQFVCETVQVVAPGDVVAVLPEQGQIKVGAGLYADGTNLHTSKAGVVRQTKTGKLWVEGRQKR